MSILEIKDDDGLRPDEASLYFDTLEGFDNVSGPYVERGTMTIGKAGIWTVRSPHPVRFHDVFVNGRKLQYTVDVILWPGPDWGIGMAEYYESDENGCLELDGDEVPRGRRYGFIRVKPKP